MVLIYAQEARLGERVAALVSARTILVTTWPDVRNQAVGARACILAFGSLEGVNLPARLSELRRWSVHAPVAIVVPLSEEHASVLATVTVERVLWAHQLDDSGSAREVLDIVPRPLQARLADAVRATERIPAADQKLLAALCETDPLPAHAAMAAKLSGASESALRRKVSAASGGVPGHATDYLLEWLRLLWACDPVRADQKPVVLARRLGKTKRTLQRTARRLTGMTLEELRHDPEAVLRMALCAVRLDRD